MQRFAIVPEPLTVSYMCHLQSSSVMLPNAALMPPCAATVCDRVGNSLDTHAVLSPASVRPTAARRPAPPAPTTMALYCVSRVTEEVGVLIHVQLNEEQAKYKKGVDLLVMMINDRNSFYLRAGCGCVPVVAGRLEAPLVSTKCASRTKVLSLHSTCEGTHGETGRQRG